MQLHRRSRGKACECCSCARGGRPDCYALLFCCTLHAALSSHGVVVLWRHVSHPALLPSPMCISFVVHNLVLSFPVPFLQLRQCPRLVDEVYCSQLSQLDRSQAWSPSLNAAACPDTLLCPCFSPKPCVLPAGSTMCHGRPTPSTSPSQPAVQGAPTTLRASHWSCGWPAQPAARYAV